MPATTKRQFLRSATLAIVATQTFRPAFAQESPVAATLSGSVRGFTDRGIKVFRGIPYGGDTAARRFLPALPPAPWPDVRPALEFGPASPQTKSTEKYSEDCLHLNVYTPALDRGARAVMVYIHGGAHSHGSGSDPLYDGVNLCRRGDVVVVTLNHRLDAFGYLYLGLLGKPDLANSGNVGTLDLVLALQWVRDNIARFGGDPGRILIFGQSGGGDKVSTLMGTPAAKGLFHRVTAMSGQAVTVSGPEHATLRARAILAALKISEQDVDAIRTIPVDRLLGALSTVDPLIGKGEMFFGPVLDSTVLPRHPFYPTAPAQSAAIPMIIGNTHDETRYFLRDEKYFHLTWDELPAALAPELVVDINPLYVIEQYRKFYPRYSPTDLFYAATTSGRSRPGDLIMAERRAEQKTPTWMYELDFKSPVDGGKWGAHHTLDIPLMFDNCDQPGSQTGTAPDALAVAARMSASMIAFAKTGDPNNAQVPHWPRYDLKNRTTMLFDAITRTGDDPRGQERRLFETGQYIKPGT